MCQDQPYWTNSVPASPELLYSELIMRSERHISDSISSLLSHNFQLLCVFQFLPVRYSCHSNLSLSNGCFFWKKDVQSWPTLWKGSISLACMDLILCDMSQSSHGRPANSSDADMDFFVLAISSESNLLSLPAYGRDLVRWNTNVHTCLIRSSFLLDTPFSSRHAEAKHFWRERRSTSYATQELTRTSSVSKCAFQL